MILLLHEMKFKRSLILNNKILNELKLHRTSINFIHTYFLSSKVKIYVNATKVLRYLPQLPHGPPMTNFNISYSLRYLVTYLYLFTYLIFVQYIMFINNYSKYVYRNLWLYLMLLFSDFHSRICLCIWQPPTTNSWL